MSWFRTDARPGRRHRSRRGCANSPTRVCTQRRAADTLSAMRVLVVTNFVPDAGAPQRGRWVRDQIEEMRRRGIEVEVFGFPPGSRQYIPATRRLRRLLRRRAALRPRPRPLRAARLVRAAGRRPAAGRQLPRHRRPPPGRRAPVAPPDPPRRPDRGRLRGALRRGGRPARPAAPPRLGGPALRPGPGPLRADAAGRGAARARASTPTAATCSSRPIRRGPRSAPTGPPELAAACGAELLSGGAIEPDRMRALDQRRQRRRRHLRLRGLRAWSASRRSPAVCRSSRPRSASPPSLLDGIDGHALRPVRARRLERRRRARSWTRPTRASTAPGGPRGSPRGGRRNARSRPTATFSPPRNRFDPCDELMRRADPGSEALERADRGGAAPPREARRVGRQPPRSGRPRRSGPSKPTWRRSSWRPPRPSSALREELMSRS